MTALIAALQRLDPACGTTAQSLLTSPIQRGAEVRRVISVLINDVLETLPDPFALILDDLHRITESSIFVALDYLLDHRPPQLHLGVATRVDPPLALARLRAARVESDPARAVGHYLAAARWPEAAELIEQIGTETYNRGYLDSLSRWINALPASVRESRPRLLYYLSNCAFWKGAWSEMQSLLERALQGFKAAGDGAGQGEVLVNLATCVVGQGDLEQGCCRAARRSC